MSIFYNADMHKINLLLKITTLGLALSLHAPVSSQIRVDARIHTSAGSCASCDLSMRRMNGMMLQDSDFSHALFNRSNLSGARFDRANLSNAHFKKALLLRVIGDEVILRGTDFQDATLTEAKLSHSNFQNSNFERADLTRATFNHADFTDSNLTSVQALETSFENSNFKNARLAHINLQNSNLRNAKFENTEFGQAKMENAKLDGAIFLNANLNQTQGLQQSELDKACGNSETRLPSGLSIPYCTDTSLNTLSDHENATHNHLNPRLARAAKDLDVAIIRLEKIMTAPSKNENKMRRELQAVHADIIASREAIEFDETPYSAVPKR